MALRQFLPGKTYTLEFDFFTALGVRTTVDQPAINLYDPAKNIILSGVTTGVSAVSGTTGRYSYSLALAAGTTLGSWTGVMAGISQSNTLFSGFVPFDVVDFASIPTWVSVDDFREYIEEPDDIHTNDAIFRRFLTTAMQLVETFTKRKWGQAQYSVVRQIRSADRLKLPVYPVSSIVGLTVTENYTPRTPGIPNLETASGSGPVVFYFRLAADTGYILFTDVAGFEEYYSDIIISLDYIAGPVQVPEPIRFLALAWCSKMMNLHQNEGLDNIRIADVNYAIRKGFLDDTSKDIINFYGANNW